jgi:acyl-homoserine-lactone acylase
MLRHTLAVLAASAAVVTLSAATQLATAPSSADAEARVRRDTYGVPHILASTERAAAMAQGFCEAEDHAEELARLFLRAQGRLAEKFGDRFVNQDLLIHRLGIPEVAQARFTDLPPHIRATFEGFAEGYNLFLSQHRDAAPEWAEPITGADLLAHVRAVSLVDFAPPDLSAIRDTPPTSSSGDAPAGSMMCLLGGTRSRSGRGLMLAAPHLNWGDSRILYEFHLRVPGYIDVAGVAPIGIPSVVIGFNERLGWALTVNHVDSDDIYELTLPDECRAEGDRVGYRYDRQCLPLEQRTVHIKVKTTSGVTEREEIVLRSHHGPIVRRDGAKAWAYRSATLDQIDFVTQLNAMAKAASVGQFQTALNMLALPLFNIGYTDRDGHLLYLFDGRFPQRAEGYRNLKTVPGDTSRSEWLGVMPMARLPQLLDPAAGYIQNTNDPPWLTVLEQPIAPEPFREVTTGQGLSLRGQHALQALRARSVFTLSDLLAVKNDGRWPLADRLKDELLDIVENAPPTPAAGAANATTPLKPASIAEADAVKALRAWNNTGALDGTGSVLFWRWWELYQKAAKPAFREGWNAAAPLETPRGIGDRPAALQAFRAAVDTLQKELGASAPAWGDVYRFRRGGLDLPLDGASGQTGTLRVVYFTQDTDRRWKAVAGESYGLGVEFQDVPVAYSVLPYSQSARASSPHFNDQAKLFVDGQYKRLWFAESDIAAHTERSYVVAPAPSTAAAAGAR